MLTLAIENTQATQLYPLIVLPQTEVESNNRNGNNVGHEPALLSASKKIKREGRQYQYDAATSNQERSLGKTQQQSPQDLVSGRKMP